jgi:hypothetical protein
MSECCNPTSQMQKFLIIIALFGVIFHARHSALRLDEDGDSSILDSQSSEARWQRQILSHPMPAEHEHAAAQTMLKHGEVI